MKPKIILFVLSFFSLTVSIFGQAKVPLSEMEGYEFWGKDQLESLKLGISTKADIKNIFGDPCEKECNFNDKWTVKFEYFNIPWMWRKEGELYSYYLGNPDYKDHLHRIKLFPKERIAFEQLKFTCESPVTLRNCKRTDNPKTSSEALPYKVKYVIWMQRNQECITRHGECKRGDLNYIEYEVTADLEEKMYIFQSSSPNPPDNIRY